MVGEKFIQISRLIQTSWKLSCTVTETVYTSRLKKLFWNWQKTKHSWQIEFISWTTLRYSTSGALYWMKQLFIIKTNSIKNGCSHSNEHPPIVPGIWNVIWTQKCSQKSISKCMFLFAFQTFSTWGGPKIYIWWKPWFWEIVLGFLISPFQNI